MDNAAWVKIFESLGKLIYDEADVNVFKYSFRDYIMKIRFHILKK